MHKFHYGENLKKIRKSKDISQDAMAYHLNISQKTYSRRELRERMPDLDEIQNTAKGLGVEPEELMSSMSSSEGVFTGYKLRDILNSRMVLIIIIPSAMILVDYIYAMTYRFCEASEASARTARIASFLTGLVSAVYLGYLIIRFRKNR